MPLGSTLLIANPAARNGEGAQAAEKAAELLRAVPGCSLEVALTRRPGHAGDLAAGAAGFQTVAVLGGDGAIHEAANGLMRLPRDERPAMGAIPVGSGNDYAFSLGMASRLDRAVSQLASAPVRWADAGTCNGEFFVETLSFGLDAGIALDTVERRKRTGATGTALYMRSGLDQLLHHLDSRRIRARFSRLGDAAKPAAFWDQARSGDGSAEGDVILCAVQVGPTYGGGFRICPGARFDDGMLDVCIAHAPVGLLKAAFVFLRAKNGRHLGFREIEAFSARGLHLEFAQPLPVQIDGERLEATEFEIGIEPAALRVIAPSDAAFAGAHRRGAPTMPASTENR